MRLFRKSKMTGRRPQISGADRPAPSMKYYSRREDQDLNTGRQQQREKRRPLPGSVARYWFRRLGLVVLLVIVVASSIDVLMLSKQAKVVTLGSSSIAYLHTPAEYQAGIDKLLASSIWNRNKITVDPNALSRHLKTTFPELASVTVTLPLLAHRPVVYIEPAQPAIMLITSSGTYVLDTGGKALLLAADPTKYADLNLPLVTDQSGLHITLNHQALTSDNVSFVQTVVAQLTAKQYVVTTLTLPAGTSELDVGVTGQPYVVKFNLQSSNARQQVGTFLATAARLSSQHVTPAHYIDVRVDGRAYYQ